jgi:hypothetical protein
MKPRDEVQPPQAQTGGANAFRGAESAGTLWGSLSWWPTLAGVGLAGFNVLDTSSGSELAPILAASALVYLGTAALRKPSAAWPLFFGTFVVITALKIGAGTFDATWVFLGLAALFVGYGLPSEHASGGMTSGSPSCTMFTSVPTETFFNVTVTRISPGRFGSSNLSVQRIRSWGTSSRYSPPKE